MTNKIFISLISCLFFTAAFAQEKIKPIDINNFDKSIRPQDDFFKYVNGSWQKNNPIPPTESIWNSFNEVNERNLSKLHKMFDEAALEAGNQPNQTVALSATIATESIGQPDASDPKSGSNDKNEHNKMIVQKVGDFYSAAMNEDMISKIGIQPLKVELDEFSLKDKVQLPVLLARMHKKGIRPGFGFYVAQDSKNSQRMICNFFQGGLGLPDRDYYLKTDEESQKIKEAYTKHIALMFSLAGYPDADKYAPMVLFIENSLAAASRARVKLRDPEANYNIKSFDELMKLTPSFNMQSYLDFFQVQQQEFNVSQPEFLIAFDSLVKNAPLQAWQAYLSWNVINSRAGLLYDKFEKADFDFYQGVLSGTKEMKPRWKRSISAANGSIGELVGQMYVEKYFPLASRKRVNAMVDNLMAVYRERINKLDWMSEETKKQALAKLQVITRKLAYPDKWRDYTNLSVSNNSYYQNMVNASEFGFEYNLSKLNKPVDKTEWGMTPQTVNAYYNPSKNEIVFPAAIMQPPFFNPDADDAVNYGCMGAVIGHEITHGFDDQGSQFDADGNLKNWWTKEDREKFNAKTDVLVKQFDSYNPIDSLHINGKLTLGENIADLGGLTMAYHALQKSMEGKPKPAKIDDLSAEQRFFVAFAQAWRNNIRPEELKKRIKTDPHSPGYYRCNGTVSNMPEFYQAFNLKSGDKLYRDENSRAKIW